MIKRGGDMNSFCDLHTHSVFSDGMCTPEQIIDEAMKRGLAAVALTDHDSIDGLPDFLVAAKGKPVEAIPGAEFAVTQNGTELHLLGLYIPEAAFETVGQLMQQVHRRREECVFRLVESLNRSGFQLDFDKMKKDAKGQVTRAHVAAEIQAQGIMDAQQAFSTLLKPGAGHYTSPERLPFGQVLEMLVEIGAVPVLAHPFLNMTAHQLEAFLPEAKKAGLVGMECIYSAYDRKTMETSFALAQSCGLLPSGGSDYHGSIRAEAVLGNGDFPVPYAYAEALRQHSCFQ